MGIFETIDTCVKKISNKNLNLRPNTPLPDNRRKYQVIPYPNPLQLSISSRRGLGKGSLLCAGKAGDGCGLVRIYIENLGQPGYLENFVDSGADIAKPKLPVVFVNLFADSN